MAVWELTFDENVPPKVVINEAVELAKAFGGDNSSKFINGVLGTVYKQIVAAKPKAKSTKKIKKSTKSLTKSKPTKKTTPKSKK